MALENGRVLETLKGRKEELEKNMQELNVQMQSISNTLLRVAGAIDVLEQIEESKSVEEIVDEVVEEIVDEVVEENDEEDDETEEE